MSIVLLGIGNPLHADDGAGPKLADMLAGTPGVTAFNCGTAPENFTGLVRRLDPDLLILDELGYLPCDTRAADILYNIISRRHEQRSTIITTNLAFKQWGTTFPGAACVVALVDRFAQHCHRVEIVGESWRDKHRLDPDRPPPKPSRSRRKRP